MLVNPQHHGCLVAGGLQYGLPMLGVVLAQPLHPPGRVVPARQIVPCGGITQRLALAQITAQAGVDKPRLGPRTALGLGRFHRLVDQRVGLVGRTGVRRHQCQRGAQQRIDSSSRLARCQLAAQGLRHAQMAQRLEKQGLHSGPQRGRDRLQRCSPRAAGTHGLQAGGHRLEHHRQRRRSTRAGTGHGGLRIGTRPLRDAGVSGHGFKEVRDP